MKHLLILCSCLFYYISAPISHAQSLTPITQQEWTLTFSTILTSTQPDSPRFQDQIIQLSKLINDNVQKSSARSTTQQDRINQARSTVISELLIWYATEAPNSFRDDTQRNQLRALRVIFVSTYPKEKERFGEDVFAASWKNLMSVCDILKLPKGNLPE